MCIFVVYCKINKIYKKKYSYFYPRESASCHFPPLPDHIVYISQIIENFTFLCNRKLFVVQQNNKNKRINVLLYILECHSLKNIPLFEYNKKKHRKHRKHRKQRKQRKHRKHRKNRKHRKHRKHSLFCML